MASRAPAKRQVRREARILPDTDAGKFLSPEQQHLLRVRREAERREARQHRTLVGLALAVIVVASTAVAWLSGWI